MGSNLGDREKYLMNAIDLISHTDNIKLDQVSSIYETVPVGYVHQGCFLNMVVSLCTDISPLMLLGEMKHIEDCLKRERHIRWGPRTLDIDILIYNNLTISSLELTIPHPRMFERAFVLIPLREIYGYKEINGEEINVLIDRCSDKHGVTLYKKTVCP